MDLSQSVSFASLRCELQTAPLRKVPLLGPVLNWWSPVNCHSFGMTYDLLSGKN